MVKKDSKGSLASKIVGVLSSTPAQFHPDDDHLDETAAKLVNTDYYSDDEDETEEILSKFRKQNIEFLDDVDKKYAGKKASRKGLRQESSDEVSESEELTSEDGEDQDNSDESNEGQSNSDDANQSDEYSDVENDTSDYSEGDEDVTEDESVADIEDEGNFKHMNEIDQSKQVKKGICVRNQIFMWENLLEVRIQMQKCLLGANRLPQGNYYREMTNDSDAQNDFKTKALETKSSLENVLDKLLTLQQLVVKKFPETKNLCKQTKSEQEENGDDDEEIPSDTEDELSQDNNSESEEEHEPQKKKRKLHDFEKEISNHHKKYSSYRNKTLEQWNARTRISLTKNLGQNQSVLSQIEHILRDKPKLIQKTQLKRSDYKILGETQNDIVESNEENGDVKQPEEYNTEIFDDSDFYHQLLRELIKVKSADITDPIQLGKQWIQLQNLRNKMKRKIDTRATKGRKVRYTVHSKLVNFMAPYETETSWKNKARNELYSSLFGKIKSKSS